MSRFWKSRHQSISFRQLHKESARSCGLAFLHLEMLYCSVTVFLWTPVWRLYVDAPTILSCCCHTHLLSRHRARRPQGNGPKIHNCHCCELLPQGSQPHQHALFGRTCNTIMYMYMCIYMYSLNCDVILPKWPQV